MGRAFEFRKARKFKRWGHMSRVFTKIGKEITIAVKAGGPDPTGNSRLRMLLATARSENMPKDTIERAIKKATDKDASDYKEIVYEGYGPFGIAILVETATDNNTRTVANVRSYFNKFGGNLGTSGSLSFLFEHKCLFTVKDKEGVELDELELELIDYGVDEIERVLLRRMPTFRSILRRTALKLSATSLYACLTTSKRLLPSSVRLSTSSSTNLRRTTMCSTCSTT